MDTSVWAKSVIITGRPKIEAYYTCRSKEEASSYTEMEIFLKGSKFKATLVVKANWGEHLLKLGGFLCFSSWNTRLIA